MKRRTHAMQKSGISPYAKKGKREYTYPAWCSGKAPIPREIQNQLEYARNNPEQFRRNSALQAAAD
jgi:hypothetical protein